MNSWDRLPFLTHVRYGTKTAPSYEPMTNEIFGNFISANYGGSQAFDNDDGSSYYSTHDNFFYGADAVKMDYSGHDSRFVANLVVVNAYDGQNCINGGGFPKGHRSNFTDNTCIIAGCRGSPRNNSHGACNERIGNFGCNGADLGNSMSASWRLERNDYRTPAGNASLPCGVTVAAAAAGNSGVERGSTAAPLPTDNELISMAREKLGMPPSRL